MPRIPGFRNPNPAGSGSAGRSPGQGKPKAPAKPVTPADVDVKWRTAFRYSLDASRGGPSLVDFPKGWVGGVSLQSPGRLEKAARHSESEPLAGHDLARRSGLGYYLDEFGGEAVQARLSCEPTGRRRPSEGEALVSKDFDETIRRAVRLSQGRIHPTEGEFVATYSRARDLETGQLTVDQTSFHFAKGDSIEVLPTAIRPDYIIHSHPYDPKDPSGYAGGNLGIDYPSGMDLRAAREMDRGDGKPAKELLKHGNALFHVHGHDLGFTRLDPKAPE